MNNLGEEGENTQAGSIADDWICILLVMQHHSLSAGGAPLYFARVFRFSYFVTVEIHTSQLLQIIHVNGELLHFLELAFYHFISCLFLDHPQFLPRFTASLSLQAKLKVLSRASYFFGLGVYLHLCDLGPFLPEVWVVEGNVGSVP